MVESEPPEPPREFVPPVPESPPMPAEASRSIGVPALALLGGLLLLALVALDSTGHLHGLERLAYVAPGLLLGAAGLILLREATTSGDRR